MVSTNSKTAKSKQKNSFEKLDDNASLKVEDMSWLIDNLPVTVFRLSNKLSWGMDYISSNVEKLTGYSKLDFIEQKVLWYDIVFPEDATKVDMAVKSAKSNKSSYQVEYRIKKADGNIAFVQEKAHLVFNGDGNLAYIAGVFLELTSEVTPRADPHGSTKTDEIIQLDMFRSFVEKISEGEGIEQISGDFTGETKKTVELINRSTGNIMGVLDEIQTISKAGKEGQLSIRAHDSKFPGGWGMLLRELNGALDSIISPLNVAAEYVERISRGDIPNLITEDYKGDFNEIKNNLNTCIAAVNLLIEDSLTISEAGVAGRLDTRADATRHEGDFRKIVEGVNETLDAVIGPLNVAAEYVERIGRGDIPDLITDNYNGDFNEIKNNLNNCIEGLQGLVECNHILHRMAMNDHSKGVEGNYVGIFDTMGKSTNEVRDRLVNVTKLMNEIAVGDTSQLMEFKKIGKRSEQDHLLPAMIQAMENINVLIEDAGMLSRAAVEGKLDTRANVSRHHGEYRKIVQGVNDTLDAVIGPLNVAAEYVERISRGDIPEPIKDNYNGDFNEIKNNLNTCIAAVNLLIEDSLTLSEAGVAGRLDTRADPTRHEGDFRKIVQGVNDTLDAVISPLNVAAEYVERISRGDIPQKITDNYNGDFNEIKNNLNNCIEGLQGLVECNNVLHHMATNDHSIGVEGQYVGIYESMAESTNEVRDRLLKVTKQLNEIAVGDTSQLTELKRVGKRCEQDHLLPAVIEVMENINHLIEDIGTLTKATLEGNLDVRMDESRHKGEYKKIVQGINDTVDAVVCPLNSAAGLIESISRGDIPDIITNECFGDFKAINNNLNACIDAINNLIEDSLMLSAAGIEGRLDTRADVTRHQGDFRRIVEGVNATLDAVIGPLNVAAEYVERISRGDIPEPITDNYNGDFNEIKNNLNTCIIAVNNLVADAVMLSEAGVAGRLDTRADATRHEGDFRKVVAGVNDTLDAVISPLNVAAEYVKRIGRGEIPEPITENYNGDFNEIKNNLNNCIDGLQGLVECNNILQLMATNDHTKRVEGKYVGIYASMGNSTNEILNRLLLVTNLINDIAVGNISQLAELKKTKQRSENDRLRPGFIRAMENIKLLIEDAEILSRAAVEGKLDTRADAFRHQGEYRKVVQGVNDTLDAVIGPLNVAAEYVERISRGDIPEPITDNYNGDFNEIKNNLNKCITAVNYLVEDALMLSKAAVDGKLDTRANALKHEGDFSKVVEGVNDTLDAVIGPLNVAAEYVERISRGDIPKPITDNYNGDFNEIKNNLNTCIVAVNNLVADAVMLSEAGVAGRLDTRADATRHEGDFRKIVAGVNDTLDAVIGPLNVAAEYVERISRGEIPEPITDNYNGDFNVLKNNINNCIEGLQGLVECNNILKRMAVNDQTKKVEGNYVGIFASMGEAINLVQARVLNVTNVLEHISVGNTSRLEELKKIGRRSEQDRLLPAMIKAMENINILIEDTEMLSKAAVEGKLGTRADASRHQGEYIQVMEGINATLDAVIGPLNVAADYVESISRGDIPEPITDNYNGDFNEIKNNLNTCITAINNLVADSLMLSEAGIAGQLETRADASRHQGKFRKIIVGVNDTLDAVIGPVNEAIRVSNEFSKGNFRARVDEKLHVEGDFINFKNVLNDIGISVSDVIKSAKSVTLNVVDSSDEASKGADEVAKAAGNVAMSSQKTSELTRELLYKIEGINKEIIELTESNEKIASTSKGILAAADEVVHIGKDAQTLGRDTNLKMESVEKIARESVVGITSLTEQIKQIDGIVQLINDITSQINLLSLNAAIEAARAGEHGRGFAVVAGEVKNLATKARNATETIENVVLSVQRDSKKTAEAINTANNEIIDGVNSVNKTLDALNTIIKNATQVTNDIGDITKAIEGQVNISMNVVTASEEGNAMTREVQKEAESLAAIAQEASASVQEIGAAIHEMTDLSNKMKSEMEVFLV